MGDYSLSVLTHSTSKITLIVNLVVILLDQLTVLLMVKHAQMHGKNRQIAETATLIVQLSTLMPLHRETLMTKSQMVNSLLYKIVPKLASPLIMMVNLQLLSKYGTNAMPAVSLLP